MNSEKSISSKLEFTQFAVDNSVDGIAWIKSDGSFSYTNKAMRQMLGYTMAELLGIHIWDIANSAISSQFVWPDHWQQLKCTDQILIKSELCSSNDSCFPVEFSLNYLEFEGEEYGFIQARNISCRKQIGQALTESESKFRDLVENTSDLIYIMGLDGKFNYVSPQSKTILGYLCTELVGESAIEYVHPEDQQVLMNAIPQLLATKQSLGGMELRVKRKDGSWCWLVYSSSPKFAIDGTIIGIQGIGRDITTEKALLEERRQNEVRLKRMVDELQQATRLKDDFLATMSHELRTPLNAILGMSEALQEEIFGAVNLQQIKSLKTIERSGKHLLELINDILDVSKISAGKLELDTTIVTVDKLCKSSLSFIKQKAIEQQIQIDLNLSPGVRALAVDERRMRQVLINLLSNAVKFTPVGGLVTLSINLWADEVDKVGVSLAVSDTGIGIDLASHQRIFEPFVQLDSSLNRNFEGTGLGLTLSRQIIELHGGQIRLKSEIGKGSCFTVYLPHNCLISSTDDQCYPLFDSLGSSPSQAMIDATAKELILLAEDNESNILTFSNYLAAKGYQIIIANTGEEAIKMACDYNPHLILMDIQMPGMDGLEAITKIRQFPELANLPIIALTAMAMAGDREKCLVAGATDYLSKPVSLKLLHTTIAHCLHNDTG